MIFKLFRRGARANAARALYDAIVAQSRRPSFYLNYGVPDSVDGRFDMIVLHLTLLFRRLRREPDKIRLLGQDVFDLFCRDMDHNLREMGVSDLAVPRQMRRVGEAFYGRLAAYDEALASADALAIVLSRNVLGQKGEKTVGACRLATYMREAAWCLDAVEGSVFAQGKVLFPDPDTVLTTSRTD